MIQINLLPDVKKEHISAVRQKKVIVSSAVIVTGVFLGLLLLLAVTVFAVQKKHISDLSSDINADIETLKQTPDVDKILTIQNQMVALPDLHQKRPAVRNIFQYLSVVTPADIKLTSTQLSFVEGAQVSAMEISGNTVTFKDANRFVDILKNARYELVNTGTNEKKEGYAFNGIVLESISKSDSSSSSDLKTAFVIVMNYDPAIFNVSYDSVKLTVPSIVSSVSSTEKPSLNKQPFENGAPQ